MDKIIVFGRGKYLRRRYEQISKMYEIECFIDNSVDEMEYDSVYGKKIYHPSKIKELPSLPIVCMTLRFVGMWKQLLLEGVDPARIKFGICIPGDKLCSYIDLENETIYATKDYLVYSSKLYGMYTFQTEREYDEIREKLYKLSNPASDAVVKLPTKPISRCFGGERGKAVDRYYVERFINANKVDITGDVMEIAEPLYTEMFGGNRVKNSIILHVKGWGSNAIKGNFETGEGLRENWVDCLICTQTMQYIFDLNTAAMNIFKILKPGGVALITVPGIKSISLYDDENWGDRWSFTTKSMRQLFEKYFSADNIWVSSWGNVKTTTAYLYGLCQEDLTEEDFSYNDPQFPFLITVRLKK